MFALLSERRARVCQMQAVRRRGVPNAVTSTLSLQKKTRGAFTTFRLTSRGVYQCAARSYAGGRRAAPSRARTPPATAIIISHKCARATASGPPRLPPARARRVPLFQRPESFFRRPRPRLAAVAATARHVHALRGTGHARLSGPRPRGPWAAGRGGPRASKPVLRSSFLS